MGPDEITDGYCTSSPPGIRDRKTVAGGGSSLTSEDRDLTAHNAPQQYDTVSRQTDEGPETGSGRENLYASSCTLPRLTCEQ
jgi:hypothetical protein